MLKSSKRPLTASETLSTILSGERVPCLYCVDEYGEDPGPRGVRFSVSTKVKEPPSIGRGAVVKRHFPSYPPAGRLSDWVSDVIFSKRGVLAATPSTPSYAGRVLAFDQRAACGHDRYWVSSMMANSGVFNEAKTSSPLSSNHTSLEAITLQSSVPSFLPEGDAYGMERADMDAFIDAGFKVDVRSKPYACRGECVSLAGRDRQSEACSRELGILAEMATRNVAPAVIAAFYARADSSDRTWKHGHSPNTEVAVKPAPAAPPLALVVVSQLSTFTLHDLMGDIKSSLVPAHREQLVTTLLSECSPVFATIRQMCAVRDGYGTVKMNMTPRSVVFCPSLVAVGSSWELEGSGYLPVSESHLDGVPKISDFNAALCSSVQEASYSFDVSYSMHCLLLVAFTRALHGPAVAEVLWKHLLADGDPSGFMAASRAMQSRPTNASSFLACMTANADVHYPPELHKALGDAASDMERAVRVGVVGKNANAAFIRDVPMFEKIVSLVTGSTTVDTLIFRRVNDDVEESAELEHLIALERVKATRLARICRTL